ncbi:MAG TPA: alpha-1,4-glucan--maltose-1-phosphate maltosyltransferase [Acidothermaceae bacterium]|jgi:starch synthase (maltosyl-transferring)
MAADKKAVPRKVPAARPARPKAAAPATRTARTATTASAGTATATETPATATAVTPLSGRIPIDDVMPVIECGRYPAKSVVGEQLTVGATVFREGHDALGVNVVLRDSTGRTGPWSPMLLVAPGTDRYETAVMADAPGAWTFQIEAWGDPLESWRHDARIKIPEGQDVELMLEEGARLHEQAAANLASTDAVGTGEVGDTGDAGRLLSVAEALRSPGDPVERLSAALARGVLSLLARHPLRTLLTLSPQYPLWVDRERALFGSWYEFFPRSEGATLDPPKSGTFATAAKRLPAIAAMGFDVVYIPPIHPIGTTFRKGRNNTLTPEPGDPGVPWAIGSSEGGHDSIHPDLGTMEDWDAFVAAAKANGLEIALDLALNASPDHPWVTQHPEWFTTRADGTIAYSENPPKKYQDIYPLNFDNDYEGLYAEVARVVRLWMSHGVRIFRVDNPHTKPVRFWEQLLADIRATDPDVLFLAEAFTRPPMMHALARIGFHQSYTYFTWRNTKLELEAYLTELSQETSDFLRPNFFVNTQDILHAFLQQGGPPAFKIRAVLAATGSPTWGVYSGYELFENVPLRPGSEEYLDSEKYQYRPRDYEAAEAAGRSLAGYITTLNRIRREHVALQRLRNLHLHSADNTQILTYSKQVVTDETTDTILVVVNLNPFNVSEATVALDMPALGVDWGAQLDVTDLLSGARYTFGQYNYVRLDPHVEPAHIFLIH